MAKPAKIVSDLQPYSAYKPSGVEWLGDVPAHWKVEPNRALFEEVNERERPDEPLLSVTITQGVIRQTELLADSSKKDSSKLDKSSYKLVRLGDIAYNKMRAWQGAIGVSWDQGIVSPAYVVQRPRNRTNSQYMHYLFRTSAFAKEAERWSYGIASDMWSLRPEQFKGIYTCLPPVPEQTAIARYLDHADRRIRRCIQAKENLVKLLEEQRQALINEAVTGRIDVRTGQPYPAYKPSGVEWLGDVPTHWDVQQLGRMGTLSKGNGGSKADEAPAGVPCVRYGDLYTTHTRFIKSSRAFVSQARAADYTPLKHGDILFAASGESIDEIGKSAVNLILSGACCGGDIIVFRPKYRTHAPFMGYVTDCWSSAMQKATMGRGFTVVHIYATQLKQLLLPVPAHSEQAAIARYLDYAERRIQRYVESEQRQIHLLNEYRSRLIADVVTGKLDVLQAASGLPNDLEDPGAIT